MTYTYDDGQDYLDKGFVATPEKALTYYKRGKVYSMIGCLTKAKTDYQEAINIAKIKDLILFGDGIFLSKDNFVNMVSKDLNDITIVNDNCFLESESK